eukprot:9502791-Pyramimonas_sp.AAC.1
MATDNSSMTTSSAPIPLAPLARTIAMRTTEVTMLARTMTTRPPARTMSSTTHYTMIARRARCPRNGRARLCESSSSPRPCPLH